MREGRSPELVDQLGQYVLLTREQAAAWCQVSVDTLDEWAREVGFPVVRGVHLVRIHRTELEKWLAARAVGTNNHRPSSSISRPGSIQGSGGKR